MNRIIALFFVLSSLLFPLCADLQVVDSDSMEIVGIKKESEDSYANYHATVTDLYSGNGTTLLGGEQIIVTLADFPSKNAGGEYADLFRFDFSTTTLVNTSVDIAVNPFVNADDASEHLEVQFQIKSTGSLTLPSGLSSDDYTDKVFTGDSKPSTETPSKLYKIHVARELIRNVASPIQLVSGEELGVYEAAVVVSGHFSQTYTEDDWTGKRWIMPVGVTLTIESGE